MSDNHIASKVLVVALGGSGRKTAVRLCEKMTQSHLETVNVSQKLKVVSVDFWPSQDGGYTVKQDDYLPILRQGTNITGCWMAFQKDLESIPEEDRRPWMKAGPISEQELSLARDAQQSGIRRVDYFLLVHLAKERIELLLRNALTELRQDGNSDKPVSIILVGSLAGRLGSISYTPIIKILDSLAAEFEFSSNFSFLYTPQSLAVPIHVENELNFFRSLSAIRRYFNDVRSKKYTLTQILVDDEDCLRDSYQEEDWPIRCNQNIERIQNLLQFRGTIDINDERYIEWFDSVRQIEDSEIDSMAENYRQRYRFHERDSFGIPQEWDANSLDNIFANVVKKS